MRRWWLLAALLVTAVVAWRLLPARAEDAKPVDQQAGPASDKRPVVEIDCAVKKTVYRKLDLPGEVLPDQQVDITSRVQGYIKSVKFDRGATVDANAVLVEIAVPELDAKLAREKAEIGLCPANIARDEATLRWRETALKRLNDVHAKSPDLVNQEQIDEAQGRYDVAKAELDLTRQKGKVLDAEAAETQAMIDLATLRAPFKGVVTERWADPGDLAQPGTSKILHIVRTDPVRVRVAVPEVEVPKVRADSVVKISIAELPTFSAERPVSRLFWALQRSTKTMWAEIDVPNADGAVRPGMYARVRVDLESHVDALVLPAAALVVEKKKAYVFVVKDGVAKKTLITLGLDDGIEFEVMAGVAPTDDVIVNGKNLVSDGTAVRAVKKEQKK